MTTTAASADDFGTMHDVKYDRALDAPVEPAALVAFRFAPDQWLGTVDAFVDVALDYRDLGKDDDEIRPVILNILPRWLRDLADRIEADGKHVEHLASEAEPDDVHCVRPEDHDGDCCGWG